MSRPTPPELLTNNEDWWALRGHMAKRKALGIIWSDMMLYDIYDRGQRNYEQHMERSHCRPATQQEIDDGLAEFDTDHWFECEADHPGAEPYMILNIG